MLKLLYSNGNSPLEPLFLFSVLWISFWLLLHSPFTLNSPLSIISRDSNSVVCIWGFSLHKLPALFDNLCMNVLREKVLASYFATVYNKQVIRKKCKVHIFWEGHKVLRNLHRRFDGYFIGQIYGEDFAKNFGLLRIYELYHFFLNYLLIVHCDKIRC